MPKTSYIPRDRRDSERSNWDDEVARFASDVEETIRQKHLANPRRRERFLQDREPTPFIGGTYHAG